MDPNTTLKTLRCLADMTLSGETSDPLATADELAALVIDLDEWLSKGGFPPEDWRHPRGDH